MRADFPVLHQAVNGKPLVYLDNASTSQKPQAVIDSLVQYYSADNSNVHRGVHTLSQRATDHYEEARTKVRNFLNAESDHEIIYVRGTTEGINLVAHSFGRQNIGEGDEIIVTAMEHHSNIVPWQILCQEKGAYLKVIPINDQGELLMDEYEKPVEPQNQAGVHRPPVQRPWHYKSSQGDHRHGPQPGSSRAAGWRPVRCNTCPSTCAAWDVTSSRSQDTSSTGPTGIGVLYGKAEMLDSMAPYQGGGEMIKSVTFEKTIYNDLPHKFEAGTPDIAGAIGLGAAIDYVSNLGMGNIQAYEHELLEYGTECLSSIEGLSIIGTAKAKGAVLSFVMEGIHPHDIGTILDTEGIAVRTGHHCAQPVMDRFEIPATARASLGLYNTKEEIDALVKGIDRAIEVFS